MIKDKFLETIKEYNMLEPKDRVLVAVSGGTDSTALLHLLDAYKDAFGITLHVAHLNHLIRKNDAELDVRYVQGLAQKLKTTITVESFDVQAYAKEKKMNLEMAARQIRYAFLERIASQIGANKIALGHTADDNVETFLMRMLRGAGLKGLCGIPPRRGKIIRPLVKIWRREIEDYVGSLKLVPRRDFTNYESRYMRNRVRLKLIPQLKIYNLNIKEIILQTILLLTEDRQYIEAKTEEALAKTKLFHSEGEIQLDVGLLKKIETPIQSHLLRMAIEKVKGDLSELSYAHVLGILQKLNAKEKWELHLPQGVFVIGGSGKITISCEKNTAPEKKSYHYVLSVPGEVKIKEIDRRIRASVLGSCSAAQIARADSKTTFVDYAALDKNLIIRNKLEGDKFYPLGMKGSKKLQDLFVDEKIPMELRDSVPVIESGGKIIWVGGLRIDERAKVKNDTKKVVKLELL
jgi:tRNA(Ile)-lysidine synthase